MVAQYEAAWALHQALDRTGNLYAVIGGVALQHWGEPRFTKDLSCTQDGPGDRADLVDGLVGRICGNSAQRSGMSEIASQNQQGSIDYEDPFWLVLAALGPAASRASLVKGLQIMGVNQSTSIKAQLAQAVEMGLGWTDRQQFNWFPEILHRATLAIVDSKQAHKIAKLDSSPAYIKYDELENQIRWAVYLNDEEFFAAAGENFSGWQELFSFSDIEWMATRKPKIQESLVDYAFNRSFLTGDFAPGLLQLAKKFTVTAYGVAVLLGDAEEALALANSAKLMQAAGFVEGALFLAGRANEAHLGFQKRCLRRRTSPLFGLPSIFARLAALHAGDLEAAQSPAYGESQFPSLDSYMDQIIGYLRHPYEVLRGWRSHAVPPSHLGFPLCDAIAGLLRYL